MSEIPDATDSDNLLDVYKAGKEREKPKKPKKNKHIFLFISLLLLFFLIGAVLFIFIRAGAVDAESGSPQFESMLDN